MIVAAGHERRVPPNMLRLSQTHSIVTLMNCDAEWEGTVVNRLMERGLCSEVVTKESILTAGQTDGAHRLCLCLCEGMMRTHRMRDLSPLLSNCLGCWRAAIVVSPRPRA